MTTTVYTSHLLYIKDVEAYRHSHSWLRSKNKPVFLDDASCVSIDPRIAQKLTIAIKTAHSSTCILNNTFRALTTSKDASRKNVIGNTLVPSLVVTYRGHVRSSSATALV